MEPDFFPDLQDPDFECSICVFHQRFSTNTQPTWSLCQPFRMLAHNGEINTVRGNRNWMTAREQVFDHPSWNRHRHLVRRLFNFNDSDSASLDNVLELLTLSGRSILHAMAMLIPPAWQNDPRIPDAQKAASGLSRSDSRRDRSRSEKHGAFRNRADVQHGR